MANIAIPATPAPVLKALTPTTDPNAAYAELAPNYQNEYNAITQEQQQLGANKDTMMSQLGQTKSTDLNSLDQAKVNAFANNVGTSNSRGLLFSGNTTNLNTNYTDRVYTPGVNKVNTTYTTGVQNADTTYNTGMQSLQDKIAQINQERMDRAQQLVLDTNAANAAAAKAATVASGGGSSGGSSSGLKASRASGGGSTKAPTEASVALFIKGQLEGLKGEDNHVSPQNLAKAYQVWTGAGQSPQKFWKYFQGYWNPKQSNYSQAFYGGM